MLDSYAIGDVEGEEAPGELLSLLDIFASKGETGKMHSSNSLHTNHKGIGR